MNEIRSVKGFPSQGKSIPLTSPYIVPMPPTKLKKFCINFSLKLESQLPEAYTDKTNKI